MSQPFDNRDYDVQQLAAKGDEIQRLQDDVELLAQNEIYHIAEIERLKEAYQSSQATVLKYWEQRNEDHKLIAELADALDYESWVLGQQCGLPSQFHDLIQRAREVKPMAEKDAEIERLKQHTCRCEASVHSTQEVYAGLQAEIERLNALQNTNDSWVYDALIKRAREAIK